jgi:hypothetical protein
MRACTASVVEIRYGLAGGGRSFATEVHWPLAPRHAAEPLGTSCVASVPAVAGGRDAAAVACSWWSMQGGGGWDRSGLREGGQRWMCCERVALCYGLQEGGGTVKYKAEITFISRAELFSEINQLIRDLRMPDGFVDHHRSVLNAWLTMSSSTAGECASVRQRTKTAQPSKRTRNSRRFSVRSTRSEPTRGRVRSDSAASGRRCGVPLAAAAASTQVARPKPAHD